MVLLLCMLQSASSAGAEALFDLRSASDLILPDDLANPNDPKVFVIDPKAPMAWHVQVLRCRTWLHIRYMYYINSKYTYALCIHLHPHLKQIQTQQLAFIDLLWE